MSWTEDADRRDAVGLPPAVQFREKWRIALAQVRAVQQADFAITAVVVDADYGTNAAFRAGLERLGLSYGVAIRGEAVFTVPGVTPAPVSAHDLATSAPDDAWETVTWGTGTAGPRGSTTCCICPPRRRSSIWSRSPAAAGRSSSRIAS